MGVVKDVVPSLSVPKVRVICGLKHTQKAVSTFVKTANVW